MDDNQIATLRIFIVALFRLIKKNLCVSFVFKDMCQISSEQKMSYYEIQFYLFIYSNRKKKGKICVLFVKVKSTEKRKGNTGKRRRLFTNKYI